MILKKFIIIEIRFKSPGLQQIHDISTGYWWRCRQQLLHGISRADAHHAYEQPTPG